MTFWTDVIPQLNAVLNASSLACLVAGLVMIRRGHRQRHRILMLSAVACSVAFLVGYIVRMSLTGAHHFPEVGIVRTLYLVLLASHSLLAAIVVPLVLMALYFALTRRFDRHRRVVRWTWPIWVYVSITGIAVYWMLYHLAPTLGS